MSQALASAREFLFRYGTVTPLIDPIELIRDLVAELEKHERVELIIKPKKPKAKAK
jgi:hypothetical protein